MTRTPRSGESGKTVKLGQDLRIATAAATFNALRDASRAKEPRVTLDGGQVEKADAAGLQAVLAGRGALASAGKKVAWSGCTPQLRSAAELLGLAEALELPR
ncbi:MAG TPA: STAS domain-containing protein [Burkholderiales bacterium]|nr:STAS domain-containing protein [Burkholderiales bacterium]